MFYLFILASGAYQPDNSGYFFIDRECVAQNDGHDPIFLGLVGDECEIVAAADKALNQAYRHALAKFEQTRRKQLKNEQRRWIKAAIVKCELDFDGAVRTPTAAGCYIREAESRTALLQKMHPK